MATHNKTVPAKGAARRKLASTTAVSTTLSAEHVREVEPTAPPTPPASAHPAFATVPDWCALTGMGTTNTYKALSRGDLQAVKLGARTLIDVAHGLAWLRNLPRATVSLKGSERTSQAA